MEGARNIQRIMSIAVVIAITSIPFALFQYYAVGEEELFSSNMIY